MEEEREEKLPQPQPQPQQQQQQQQFLEVSCRSSGKIRRFAAGTEAGFALYMINKKLAVGAPLALHIEAFKEGEEPVTFGPNAILVNYGTDWKLQTITKEGFDETKQTQQTSWRFSNTMNLSGVESPNGPRHKSVSPNSLWYIGKIMFAFALICLLGGTLALFLEKLPDMILFVNSSL